MNKMSVSDAAEYFGISKEAIHNRIRRGSLRSVIENGVKMVVVDSAGTRANNTKRTTSAKQASNDERYYKLLEEQNAKLQARVETLEDETRSLRDQKEQMLIKEREKIEQIYKEKDEQLKNILSAISSQFMLNTPVVQEQEVEMLDAEIEVEEVEQKPEKELQASEVISLKKYLKKEKYSEKKVQKIKKRFDKCVKKEDERIIIIGSKYYIDTSKYDYSDLIK
jgi:valyl-tRNA synthetase